MVSYNLHGFNQGSHEIKDMVSTFMPDVIMIQEHWLTPDNLSKLSELSSNYFVFGSSAMTSCCLLYTSPSPRDGLLSRMPSSA